jgi:hypothetical protein
MGRAVLASDLGVHRGLSVTVIVSTTLDRLQGAARQCAAGHLFRSKRIASADQRIMLHSLDRGCTFPGCDKPGYLSEVHHIQQWAAEHGPTNIDLLTFAADHITP